MYHIGSILALMVFAVEASTEDNPLCWRRETSAEIYPYLASVHHHDCDHNPHRKISYGAIISADYVLALNKIRGTCELHTVHVGQDASGNGGHQYNATLKTIGTNGELALFKLDKPIEFGPLARAVPMMSASAKTGALATRSTAMDRKERGILAGNLTAIAEKDCRDILKKHGQTDFLPMKWFCTEDRANDCPTYTYSTLVIGGELAGFGENFVRVPDRNMLARYIDVAQYSQEVKQHMEHQ